MTSNEENFIKRLQRQKEDALEFIVDTYLPIIKGITYKVLIPLNDQGVIDECINDIFYPSGTIRKSSKEIQLILESGFVPLLSLKRLIITEKRVKR